MAGLPVRDRIRPPAVARAAVSPGALVGAGAGVGIGALTGLGLPVLVILGAIGWTSGVGAKLARSNRRPRPERIDPFTLHDPWRTHVQNAQASRARVRERADSAPPGPVQDRLQEIGRGVDAAVQESWQIAKRGQSLANARRTIQVEVLDRQVQQLEKSLAEAPEDQRLAEALASRTAQRATAERMDRVIDDTDTQLKLMDARLGEVVVAAAEVSAQASGGTALDGLYGDVESLVTELEALRLALDEVHGIGGEGDDGRGLPASAAE